MVNTWFKLINEVPSVFDALENAPLIQNPTSQVHEGKKGIYVFKNLGIAKHVGRTRNLQQRMLSHRTKSHNSASLAFKMARNKTEKYATYKTEGSRKALLENPEFYKAFIDSIEEIKKMDVYFVEVPSHEMQYLVKLYAYIKYGLPTDEFDTS